MTLLRTLLTATAVGLGLRELGRATARTRFPLEGKVVFLTGGSRGLGLELARQLAKRGARLALVARDQDELARAAAALEEYSTDVLTIAADVSDRAQARAAARTALGRFHRVDVLINCAGQISVGPVTAVSHDDFERAMSANFWSAQNCVEALLPELKANGEARIVNISSIGGLVGVPHLAPYVASKFALTGYSLTLRAELAKYGIRVVTVCPGLMRTGSADKATFKGDVVAEHAWFKTSDALPLISMNAERAAEQIVLATQSGQARLILTVQAKVAAVLEALAPGLVAGASTWAERLLPSDHASETRDVVPGSAIPDVVPRFVTALGDAASVRNNEV